MASIAKGRTVLIIAHRLSAVRACHRILTIEKGRLVEDGSHAELMQRGGRYAQLYRFQAADASGSVPAQPANALRAENAGGQHASQ